MPPTPATVPQQSCVDVPHGRGAAANTLGSTPAVSATAAPAHIWLLRLLLGLVLLLPLLMLLPLLRLLQVYMRLLQLRMLLQMLLLHGGMQLLLRL